MPYHIEIHISRSFVNSDMSLGATILSLKKNNYLLGVALKHQDTGQMNE